MEYDFAARICDSVSVRSQIECIMSVVSWVEFCSSISMDQSAPTAALQSDDRAGLKSYRTL